MQFQLDKDLKKFLDQNLSSMEDLLKNAASTESESIKSVINGILKGKKIRAMLCILSFMLCQTNEEEIQDEMLNSALAIELIHNATLLHDDVVDDNNLRRGDENAKSLFGNKISVLSGDFVLSIAFGALIKCDNIKAIGLLCQTASMLSKGEIRQLEMTGKVITKKQYLEVIEAKTAALFSAACEIAAIVCQREDLRGALKNFGYTLGMAFQMIDDILDYSTNQNTGKQKTNDFDNFKFTLPCILAYEGAKSKEEKLFWSEDFFKKERKLSIALNYITKTDALFVCRKFAETYIQKAKGFLLLIEDSIYKSALEKFLDFVIERDY